MQKKVIRDISPREIKEFKMRIPQEMLCRHHNRRLFLQNSGGERGLLPSFKDRSQHTWERYGLIANKRSLFSFNLCVIQYYDTLRRVAYQHELDHEQGGLITNILPACV